LTAAARARCAPPVALLQVLLLVVVGLSSGEAFAQRVIHRVRFGEDLEGISLHYYGTRDHGQLLALANGFSSPRKLVPGEKIRVPTTWTHTVRKTSTVQNLARDLLGGSHRWPALVVFNRLGHKKKVKVGVTLTVPFTLVHTATLGETLDGIGRIYYGDSRYGALLQRYNQLTSTSLAPGAKVEVPMGAPQITAERMEELVSDRLLGVERGPSQESRETLQEANAMLRRGEYMDVPLRLIRFLVRDQSSDAFVAEVFKLLAIAYVAVDRADLAQKAFLEALLRQPGLTLDPVNTSPKVLQVLTDTRGKIKRGGP
jgi:LysM repeat protein